MIMVMITALIMVIIVVMAMAMTMAMIKVMIMVIIMAMARVRQSRCSSVLSIHTSEACRPATRIWFQWGLASGNDNGEYNGNGKSDNNGNVIGDDNGDDNDNDNDKDNQVALLFSPSTHPKRVAVQRIARAPYLATSRQSLSIRIREVIPLFCTFIKCRWRDCLSENDWCLWADWKWFHWIARAPYLANRSQSLSIRMRVAIPLFCTFIKFFLTRLSEWKWRVAKGWVKMVTTNRLSSVCGK